MLSHPPGLCAQTNTKSYHTAYAVIFYGVDKDLFTFTKNIESGFSLFQDSPEKNPLLAKNRVDKIVDLVGGLLDMRPPNLHFSILLYRTQEELDRAYRKASGFMGGASAVSDTPAAFYSHHSRSIAVSIDAVTDRMLAHEIAHAIICFYFGTPPPMRMQEVLAQYVDKHLGEE